MNCSRKSAVAVLELSQPCYHHTPDKVTCRYSFVCLHFFSFVHGNISLLAILTTSVLSTTIDVQVCTMRETRFSLLPSPALIKECHGDRIPTANTSISTSTQTSTSTSSSTRTGNYTNTPLPPPPLHLLVSVRKAWNGIVRLLKESSQCCSHQTMSPTIRSYTPD